MISRQKGKVIFTFLFLIYTSLTVYSINRFEHLAVEDGLAHTDATCLLQDSSGLIWIGTNAGLQSYDGYKLQTFDYYKNSSSRIHKLHNRVTSLGKSGDRLWVGTKSGLLCMNLLEHNFTPFKVKGSKQILSDEIKLLYVDFDKNLWIKTDNYIYITHYNKEEQILYVTDSIHSISPKPNSQDIFAIQGCQQLTWLCTAKEVMQVRLRKNKLIIEKKYTTDELLSSGQTLNSFYLHNEYLYFRTNKACVRFALNSTKKGINISSRRIVTFSDWISGLPSSTSGKIVVDKNETLWCIYQDGLIELRSPFSFPQGKLHKKEYCDSKSLSTNFLSTLYTDAYNNLWVGTWGGGVNYLSLGDPLFQLIHYTPGSKYTISDLFVKAVEKDVDGTLWILTQKGGLNHYDIKNGLIKSYDFSQLLLNNKLYKDLLISPDKKTIFIGTAQGLLAFDKRTEKATYLIGDNEHAILKKAVHVYSLDIDRYGNLWVGTWDNGLICLKYSTTGTRVLFQLNEEGSNSKFKLSSDLVSHVYCDRVKNEVMVCTDRGLNRIILKGENVINKIVSYKANASNKNSLSCDFLSVIDKQNDSTYWVGTLGGGLNKLVLRGDKSNSYSATSYTTQDGLSSNDVEIVLVDNQSNIWFGGNGITKLDPKTNRMSFYDYKDGLQGNSFKIGAGYKDNKGILYFGGIYGLNYFDPKSIKTATDHSYLIFTDLLIHNHLIEVGVENNGHVVLSKILNEIDNIVLHYDQNDFTLSFSALNFWSSSRICYRYRLKGYDKDWIHIPGSQNSVFYSNLDYGTYTFQIQVSSDAGNTWNEQNKTLSIKILPPWWLSIWAKIFYTIILLTIIIVLLNMYAHELRMRHQLLIKDIEDKKKEENHQLKLQFFMNISHEFKTPLTLILSSIERMGIACLEEKERINFFETISRNANKMLTLITELMDFRKTDIGADTLRLTQGNVNTFVSQIADEFTSWANKKNIKLDLSSEEIINMSFDREKFAKIICNLLSNALKYTENGGNVEVILKKGHINSVTSKYSIKHIEPSEFKDEESCIIIVRDTGIGITSESISHIFDRFFQVESITSMHLGSGIGLAVAKNMVLSHNGCIMVSSQRNVGTEFIVFLPLVISSPDIQKVGEEVLFDINLYLEDQHIEYNYELSDAITIEDTISSDFYEDRPILLIVEDNLELLFNLKQYFNKWYQVLTAENGKIGLELCKENFPDLIISDVMMPEMNGVQLCREIRENLNIAYTPIILLTAKSEVEEQIEGYEAGADLYIPKPFSLKMLELNIARLIAHKNDMLRVQSQEHIVSIQNEISQIETPQINLREEIKDSKDKEFLQKLNVMIVQNLDNPEFSVEHLCKDLGVGRTKLYTKVKDLAGQPLGDLIRDIRLNKSAYLLRNSDKNITEIIYEIGFGSNSHFSKAFKAKFGMTPSEYSK